MNHLVMVGNVRRLVGWQDDLCSPSTASGYTEEAVKQRLVSDVAFNLTQTEKNLS